MFYCDKEIREFEEKLNYSPIINKLKEKYTMQGEIIFLNSIIAYSWYYLVEGDVNQMPINYDWKFLLDNWKKYIDIGIEENITSPYFYFIVGYTLDLHGDYISQDYQEKGKKFMEKCLIIKENSEINRLARKFLLNENDKEKINTACNHLFPNNSLIDQYFKSRFLIK